jgi:hypothetical protein
VCISRTNKEFEIVNVLCNYEDHEYHEDELELFNQKNGFQDTLRAVQNESHVVVVGDS